MSEENKNNPAAGGDHDADSDMDYRVVGRIKDAHGLKGEIWVVLFAGAADWLGTMKADGEFCLSEKEELSGAEITSYPLKGARIHKNGVILQSPAIKDRTMAERLRGQFLAIPEDYLIGDDDYYLDEIEGFTVFEGDKAIGEIVGFSDNGAHDLLVVDLLKDVRPGVKKGDQIQVPFVEDLVVDVDEENEKILMTLPAGLIEVQLGLDQDDESVQETDESDEDEGQ